MYHRDIVSACDISWYLPNNLVPSTEHQSTAISETNTSGLPEGGLINAELHKELIQEMLLFDDRKARRSGDTTEGLVT